jgi:hypothetical protein
MSWYKIEFTPAEIASGKQMELQNIFEKKFSL